MNQSGLHEGIGRAHLAEPFAVDARHRLPVLHPLDVDPRAHYIAESCPHLAQRALDPVQDEARLASGIAHRNRPIGTRRGRARDQHTVADPDRPG